MLDSESQLREAILKMERQNAPAEAVPPTSPAAPSTVSTAGTNQPAPHAEPVVYICPMPEHVSLEYDHPGKCPLCSMTLVPVGHEMLSRIRPKPAAPPGMTNGAMVMPQKLYTCPMAEHADVVSDTPGRCPKCDMQLVETSTVNHGETAEANWRRQHGRP